VAGRSSDHGLAIVQSSKYCPVTLSSSEATAAHTEVAAPCSTVFMRGLGVPESSIQPIFFCSSRGTYFCRPVNRHGRAGASLNRGIAAHIHWLRKQLAELNGALEQAIRRSPL
jgi:hypothetical protein